MNLWTSREVVEDQLTLQEGKDKMGSEPIKLKRGPGFKEKEPDLEGENIQLQAREGKGAVKMGGGWEALRLEGPEERVPMGGA